MRPAQVRHTKGWDTLDQRMVLLAAARSEVLYLDRDDREYRVVLVAWRGRCGSGRCRIQRPSGKQVTVNIALVRPIPITPEQP